MIYLNKHFSPRFFFFSILTQFWHLHCNVRKHWISIFSLLLCTQLIILNNLKFTTFLNIYNEMDQNVPSKLNHFWSKIFDQLKGWSMLFRFGGKILSEGKKFPKKIVSLDFLLLLLHMNIQWSWDLICFQDQNQCYRFTEGKMNETETMIDRQILTDQLYWWKKKKLLKIYWSLLTTKVENWMILINVLIMESIGWFNSCSMESFLCPFVVVQPNTWHFGHNKLAWKWKVYIERKTEENVLLVIFIFFSFSLLFSSSHLFFPFV